MLTNIERIHLKGLPPRGSRLLIAWFIVMLLVALISAGMLVAGIIYANPDSVG